MKKMLVAGLLLLMLTKMDAQTATIDNIRKTALRTSNAIKEGSEVKGYYFFYVSDKIDKKTNEYTLRIMDNNLKVLKDIKFEDSKDVTILESSFNGTDLIFLFYNSKERTMEHQVYGANGQKKSTYTRELTKKERRYLETTYLQLNNDDDDTFKGLYPVEGKGFISNMPSREDKDYTFQVDYFSTEKRSQWTFTPTDDAKKFVGDFLGTYNGVVYFSVLKFKSIMDQKPDGYILGLNLENGQKVFEISTESKNLLLPASLTIANNGNAYLYGEYFNSGENVMKDKSNGFAFWGINEKGKILSEKYNSWENEMSKYLDVKANGKIDDFGYLCLHSMVQTADGTIYAIGEGYKKVASALGIAATILSRNSNISTVKIKVTDMMLLKFDKNFALTGATVYNKNSNNVELPSGYEFVSGPLISKIIKYNLGAFDYSYTQVSKDASSFTVCYSDYVRGKDYKGATFNSITYNNGKITTDNIKTKSDATRTWVLPAKQGQVLIMDYFRKDKRLDIHLEKLN